MTETAARGLKIWVEPLLPRQPQHPRLLIPFTYLGEGVTDTVIGTNGTARAGVGGLV